MTKPKTPPAEWDRRALEIARGIASIDRSKLPGLTNQFVAILQEAIVSAMTFAVDTAPLPCGVTILRNEIRLTGVNVSDAEMQMLRAIADRMNTRGAAPSMAAHASQCSASHEHGSADKPAPGTRETALGAA